MNEIQMRANRRGTGIVLTVVIAAMIGASASLYSVYTALAAISILTGIALLLKPNMLPLGLLVASAVSLDVLFTFSLAGFDAVTMYKLGILAIVALAVFMYGYTFEYILPVAVLMCMMGISYTVSGFHESLSSLSPLIVFLGVGSPFLLLFVKWDKRIAEHFLLIIPVLPAISVGAGALLELLGMHTLMYQEYLGAYRLQGANMGAHLAMLSFIGLGVSLVEMKRRPSIRSFFFVFAGLNFIIMFSTGTRGALLASLLLLVLFALDYLQQYMKGKILAILPLILFLSIGTAVLIVQWENILDRTFNEHANADTGINLSGREVAWAYFLTEAKGNELFGQGLGSSLVANDGSLFEGFSVPHNEYIRFYFDAGLVGASFFFLALLSVFYKIGAGLTGSLRIYHFTFIVCVLIYSFVDNTLTTIHFIVPFCFYLAAVASINRATRAGE